MSPQAPGSTMVGFTYGPEDALMKRSQQIDSLLESFGLSSIDQANRYILASLLTGTSRSETIAKLQENNLTEDAANKVYDDIRVKFLKLGDINEKEQGELE
jgi:hypothetical protein